MRILILHNFYQHLGGEDIVVQQEADELSKRGHQVIIITQKNAKSINGLIQYGMYPYNIVVANKLINRIKKFSPEIIHIHNLHYAIGPLVIRKLKKKGYPVVMTLHNFRLICPSATLFYRGSLFTKSITENFPWSAVKEKVLENSFIKTFITAFTYWSHRKLGTWYSIDKYFTFSDFSKNIFCNSTLNLSPEKLIIKPNFTNAIARRGKTFSNNFIYVGRLSTEKGIIPLLQAISKTTYTLKIFGSGPLEKQVKEFAKQYSNIQYLGFQNKEILTQEIRNANALIVPSVCYEGMPMNIIEAFAIGTPVLCSNIGILEQMVVPLRTGLHFDPNSIQSIINCLQEWTMLDKESKLLISENCINEFQKEYTADRNMLILEHVYKQILKEYEHHNYRSSQFSP